MTTGFDTRHKIWCVYYNHSYKNKKIKHKFKIIDKDHIICELCDEKIYNYNTKIKGLYKYFTYCRNINLIDNKLIHYQNEIDKYSKLLEENKDNYSKLISLKNNQKLLIND